MLNAHPNAERDFNQRRTYHTKIDYERSLLIHPASIDVSTSGLKSPSQTLTLNSSQKTNPDFPDFCNSIPFQYYFGITYSNLPRGFVGFIINAEKIFVYNGNFRLTEGHPEKNKENYEASKMLLSQFIKYQYNSSIPYYSNPHIDPISGIPQIGSGSNIPSYRPVVHIERMHIPSHELVFPQNDPARLGPFQMRKFSTMARTVRSFSILMRRFPR